MDAFFSHVALWSRLIGEFQFAGQSGVYRSAMSEVGQERTFGGTVLKVCSWG
jgi:hypothetical protein